MKVKKPKFSRENLFAKRKLKKLRIESGLSRRDVAEELGIRDKNIEDLEAEKNYGCHISLDHLIMMSKFYGVCISEFVETSKSLRQIDGKKS